MPTDSEIDYPHQYESRLTLDGGEEVFLRPIRQSDGDLLSDLVGKMSSRSLYLRFLWWLNAIPEDMLYRFTHVNYKDDFAIVAVIEEDGKEAIVAVGRYIYDPGIDQTDLAVTVRDDWQHHGLGKYLLAKTVAIAKEHGISHFKTMMDPGNKAMMRIFLELGYKVNYTFQDGTLEVSITA
jgi:acetyltransferase